MKLTQKIAVLLAFALAAVLGLSGCGGGTAGGTIPTATITSAAGTGGAVVFTFAFNESVGTTFNAAEVTVTGGTAASSVTSIGSNSYTLVVTPTAGATSVVVTLPANKVTDVTGNSNTAVATNTYTVASSTANITIVGTNTTPVTGENLNPNWGQATAETTATGNVMNMTSFNYQGIDLTAKPVNATGMQYLHLDFTASGITTLGVALVTNVGITGKTQAESPYSITSISSTANSIDIPMSAYTGGTPVADITSIGQIKLTNGPDNQAGGQTAGGTLNITNMYFSASATSGSTSGTSGGSGGGTTISNSGGTTGSLNFMTGFKTASTVEGGAYGGTSGSSLDGYTCPGFSATATTSCGSGGSFTDGSSPAANAAASNFYAYYQFKGTAPAGEYAGIYVFAPGVTALSATADTAGMTLNGQTKVNFNLGMNSEFFSNTNHNVAVLLKLGKYYTAGGACNMQLQTVFTPTSATSTSYSLPLSAFAVAQDCATGTPPTGYLAALTAAPAISEIVFEAASGAALFHPNLTGSLTSGANTTVANGTYIPTTLTLTGGITFQ